MNIEAEQRASKRQVLAAGRWPARTMCQECVYGKKHCHGKGKDKACCCICTEP